MTSHTTRMKVWKIEAGGGSTERVHLGVDDLDSVDLVAPGDIVGPHNVVPGVEIMRRHGSTTVDMRFDVTVADVPVEALEAKRPDVATASLIVLENDWYELPGGRRVRGRAKAEAEIAQMGGSSAPPPSPSRRADRGLRVLARDRQHGKTTDLIMWAAEPEGEHPRYICVADQRRARHVADMAAGMGLSIRFPVTFDEVLQGHHHGRRLELGVDDAEELIARVLAPQHVAVIAIQQATEHQG